mmetsp:Transcript_57749/g.185612  ORF Transcript_57749/g.185612 Transcript_57749/m.185612 type:complete len:212 (+) Transcript_57749:157-792(+)
MTTATRSGAWRRKASGRSRSPTRRSRCCSSPRPRLSPGAPRPAARPTPPWPARRARPAAPAPRMAAARRCRACPPAPLQPAAASLRTRTKHLRRRSRRALPRPCAASPARPRRPGAAHSRTAAWAGDSAGARDRLPLRLPPAARPSSCRRGCPPRSATGPGSRSCRRSGPCCSPASLRTCGGTRRSRRRQQWPRGTGGSSRRPCSSSPARV